MNRRGAIRALIATLIASPGALPIAALGQTRIPRIALITGNSKQSFAEPIEALREGLAKLGYQEGRNYSFDPRFGDFGVFDENDPHRRRLQRRHGRGRVGEEHGPPGWKRHRRATPAARSGG